MIGISRALEMEGNSTWESIKYLGIPLVKEAPRSSPRLPLMDKMKTRILASGTTWMNKDGKLILINVVLTSLPVYQASILFSPRGIVREIDNILRKFLWEGGRNEGKKCTYSVGIRLKPLGWKVGYKSKMWPLKI
jgi:hypothetical protein